MKKTILIYGSLILAIAILFQLSKVEHFAVSSKFDFVLPLVAVIFFVIGSYLNTHFIQKSVSTKINHQKIKELNLSNREYEVLCEIANGLSNLEIADKLFLSESTIKTHVSSLLVKLNAKRRTQAIQISKTLNILPQTQNII